MNLLDIFESYNQDASKDTIDLLKRYKDAFEKVSKIYMCFFRLQISRTVTFVEKLFITKFSSDFI